MPKINKKITLKYTGVYFLLFLCIFFFNLTINKALADLNVPLPGLPATGNVKLPDYVLALFNFGMSLGLFAVFISLVIAGVMYILSPVSAQLKAEAKDRISGAISGLLILALTYLIVTTINPQLAILHLTPLKPSPAQTITPKRDPGVYFYTDKSNCPDTPSLKSTSSQSDLGSTLSNKINTVDIAQDIDNQASYITILYKKTDFFGQCVLINGNTPCESVDPFASSASIYKFDYAPSGDGVTFYRKSYFNPAGGSLKISNSEIENANSNLLYAKNLNQLFFTGVPTSEQDCIKYDTDGQCDKNGRRAPSLGGNNISSIQISPAGAYLVLLTYAPPGQDCSTTPWDSCQEFPTIDDVNRVGPRQIKWENIETSVAVKTPGGVLPNCVVIIPVQQ